MRNYFWLLFIVSCATNNDDCTTGKIIVVVAQDTVTAMSYNIFHDAEDESKAIPGWNIRRKIIVDTIHLFDPDIVGLQEAYQFQVEFLKDAIPDYTSVGRGRNEDGSGETVSILFKSDAFEQLESGHFWYSPNPDTPGSKGGEHWGNQSLPRMATWVRLRKKNTEHAFYVFNTHWASNGTADDPDRARLQSAILLADRIAARAHPDEHYLVTGDFNASAASDPGNDPLPIRYLVGTASSCTGILCPVPAPTTPTKLFDVWRVLNTGAGGTKCSNVEGATDGGRIDYIFGWNPAMDGLCAGNSCEKPLVLEAVDVPRIWGCGSDHRPVFAKITLPLITF